MIITSNVMKLIKHPRICSGDIHPISAQLDLTNLCNLRCLFCTAAESRAGGGAVDIKLIEKVLLVLKNLGCVGIEYTGGGEPLLYNGFYNVISMTKGYGFDIGLVTNGTMITKQRGIDWGWFDWVRVSLNAGPELYESVHGVKRFDNVLSGLIQLDSSGCFYGVSYVYTGQHIEDFHSMCSVLSEKLNNLGYIRIACDVKKEFPTAEVTQELYDVAFSLLSNSVNIDVQVDREMWVPEKCVMYKIKPRVDVSGFVYPCCISQYLGINCVGTIDDYNVMMERGDDFSVNTGRCPYCIYGGINNFLLGVINSDVKNPNFI